MQVLLQIKKKELDLIRSGTKKNEWRHLSAYNKKLLLKQREDGKGLDGNAEIKSVKLVNGYAKEREILVVSVAGIQVFKFLNDKNIPEDNFTAHAGQAAIRIQLGEIIS